MMIQNSKSIRITIGLGLLLLSILILKVLEFPLTGTHKIRQADTLFTAYSYCIGDSTFLYPKVAHREATEGIAIGEFPIFSALISIPCTLTNTWNEITPKVITYLIWILNLFIWSFWFRRRYPDQKEKPETFLLFFIFTPLLLTYLLIPIPDVLAIAITGLAAIAWQKENKFLQFSGCLLFTIAFLMRPYLFPLLLLFAPNWVMGGVTFFLIGISYLVWFKLWIRHTQIWYYLTDTKPLSALFESGLKAPVSLIQQILLNHLNYIGLIPFFISLKLNRRLLIVWLFSLAFIVLLKSDHFVNHAYYFMATGLISAIGMTEGFMTWSKRKQNLFAIFFVTMSLIATQHNWRPPVDQRPWTLPALMDKHQVRFSDRIAVYDKFNPQTLYLAKRVGWYFEKDEWKGPKACPSLATWALLFDDSDSPSLIRCEHVK